MIKSVIGRPPEVIDIAVQHLQAHPEGFMGPWFLGLVGLTYMMLRELESFVKATDVAITGLTLWKIMHGGKTYSPQTQHGLQRLRNLTAEAAVPPTICVILNIGFFLGMGNKNLVSHWFAIVSPTLYVWSMMFTLNSRVAIRRTFNTSTQEEDETLSTSFQFAKHKAGTKGEQGETQKTTTTFAAIPELSYPERSLIDAGQERLGGNSPENTRRSKEDLNAEIV
ncbi:hypothetical protein FRC00_009913 [Tulasnella sp. 408]|nr:hypothetical protein FRC00_009913 [Tulasnella sp. 408]